MQKLFSIILLLPVFAFAHPTPDQAAQIDSLQQVVQASASDSSVVNALVAWDNLIYISDPEQDFHLNQQIERICRKNLKSSEPGPETRFFLKHLNFSLNNLGIYYKRQGDFEKAIEYYTQSLQIREASGDQKRVATALNNIGNVYKEQGDYDRAMDYYHRSLGIREAIGDKKGHAMSLTTIGVVHSKQGDYEKAEEYYWRSLKLNKEIGYQEGIATSHNNLGASSQARKDYPKAIEHLQKSMEISTRMGDQHGMQTTLNGLGKVYVHLKAYEESMNAYRRALEIGQKMGHQLLNTISLSGLSETSLEMGNYPNAIEYGTQAWELAEELGVMEQLAFSSFVLSRAYKATGQKDLALDLYEQHISIKDSLKNQKFHMDLIRQEYQYTYEKAAFTDSLKFAQKEALLEERDEKQRIGLSAAVGALLLLGILAFVIYKGKRKSDHLLLNTLPRETAEELKRTGSAKARSMEAVTVMFTDVVGFTKLSEELSPEQLVSEINECFSAFDLIIESHGIEKIKTIGDAYMAAGGLPTPTSTHALKVVQAALEIQRFMKNWSDRKERNGELAFDIRIGIHTGPVVAGVVGIKKFQYDIWGDTVNTASRMESSGMAGRVNISEATYQLVKKEKSLSFEARGRVLTKGKGELDMYFVEQATSGQSSANASSSNSLTRSA